MAKNRIDFKVIKKNLRNLNRIKKTLSVVALESCLLSLF